MWPKKLLLLSFKRECRGKEERSKTKKDLEKLHLSVIEGKVAQSQSMNVTFIAAVYLQNNTISAIGLLSKRHATYLTIPLI